MHEKPPKTKTGTLKNWRFCHNLNEEISQYGCHTLGGKKRAILISLPVPKTNHYDAISLMSTRAIFNNAAVLPLILNHRNINQKAAGWECISTYGEAQPETCSVTGGGGLCRSFGDENALISTFLFYTSECPRTSAINSSFRGRLLDYRHIWPWIWHLLNNFKGLAIT